jgi:hypothetical protein
MTENRQVLHYVYFNTEVMVDFPYLPVFVDEVGLCNTNGVFIKKMLVTLKGT